MKSQLNFRLFRKILKKTQEELAAELGVCKATICNIERGATHVKINYLHYLHRKYGLNINWMLTGNGNVFVKLNRGLSIDKRYSELFHLMKIPGIEKEILQTLIKAKDQISKK